MPFCLGRPALAADFFWYSKKTNRPRKREAAVAVWDESGERVVEFRERQGVRRGRVERKQRGSRAHGLSPSPHFHPYNSPPEMATLTSDRARGATVI